MKYTWIRHLKNGYNVTAAIDGGTNNVLPTKVDHSAVTCASDGVVGHLPHDCRNRTLVSHMGHSECITC